MGKIAGPSQSPREIVFFFATFPSLRETFKQQ
jgi:hypothetical protein